MFGAAGLPLDAGPTSHFAERLLYEGHYELDEMTVTRRLVPRGGTVIDAGANIGIYTLLLADLVGEGGVVHAVEPSPVAWHRLEEATGTLGQVHRHRVALGAEKGEASMAVADGDSMHSTLRAAAALDDVIAVGVTTLDALVGDRAVDFVKVDVEGYEAELLRGARQSLHGGWIGAMLLEVAPQYGSVDWATELHELAGYRAFAVARGNGRGIRHRVRLVRPPRDRGFSMVLIRDDRVAAVADLVA